MSPPSKMQYMFLCIVTFLTLIVIIVPIIAFCVINNFFCLIPTVLGALPLRSLWKQMAQSVFPRYDKEYELEAKKIEHSSFLKKKIRGSINSGQKGSDREIQSLEK